jgi:hypothetical protein
VQADGSVFDFTRIDQNCPLNHVPMYELEKIKGRSHFCNEREREELGREQIGISAHIRCPRVLAQHAMRVQIMKEV